MVSQLRFLDSEKWLDIQGFTNSTAYALCREASRRKPLAKIPSLSLELEIALFQSLPKKTTIGKDRNKDWFKNRQLCGVWTFPFCDHREIQLTQNWVCFTTPCINLLVPPSVTGEYHRKFKVLELSACCSALSLTCSVMAWVLVLICILLGRTHLKTDQVYVEDPVQTMQAVPNWVQRASGWPCNCSFQQWRHYFRNYGRQRVQFISCLATVLLSHTESNQVSLFPHICLTVFLQSNRIQ